MTEVRRLIPLRDLLPKGGPPARGYDLELLKELLLHGSQGRFAGQGVGTLGVAAHMVKCHGVIGCFAAVKSSSPAALELKIATTLIRDRVLGL